MIKCKLVKRLNISLSLLMVVGNLNQPMFAQTTSIQTESDKSLLRINDSGTSITDVSHTTTKATLNMNTIEKDLMSLDQQVALYEENVKLQRMANDEEEIIDVIGSEENPFAIGSAGLLNELANKVNSGETYNGGRNKFSEAYYIVTRDLDMSNGHAWITIGNTAENAFKGTFDGQWHLIYNLMQSTEIMDYQGLFGVLGENAVIQNTGVSCDFVSGEYVGGIAAVNRGGTIKNSYVEGHIIGTNYIGGIVGSNFSGTIEKNYVTAIIEGEDYIGGIAGNNLTGSIRHNVALNQKITGQNNVHRIVGATRSGGEIKENYAWGDIEYSLLGSNHEDTSNHADLDGETKGAVELRTDLFWRNLGIVKPNPFPKFIVDSVNIFSGGDGTEQNPYIITKAEELRWLAKAVNMDNADYNDKYYRLGNDIDLSIYLNWEGIGSNPKTPFKGHFDGAGRTIKNLTAVPEQEYEEVYRSLFGYLTEEAKISNLNLMNFNINGLIGVGSLASTNMGTLQNITVSDSTIKGHVMTGGLVGMNFGKIMDCEANTITRSTGTVGGLVGYNTGEIQNSMSKGEVDEGDIVGGLVGSLVGGRIKMSASEASVKGKDYVGGLVGNIIWNGSIENCYATGRVDGITRVGGLVGGIAGGKIENSVAMNLYILGNQQINRLVGEIGLGTNTFDNNYAWDRLRVNYKPFSDTINEASAQSVTTNQLIELEFWKGVGRDKVPSMPEHVTHIQNIASFASGKGTKEEPYEISDANELYLLAKYVAIEEKDSQGQLYSAGHYKLSKDIDLSSYDYWEPIGRKSNDKSIPFTGSFDGNDKKIKGMKILPTNNQYQGLFGYTQNAELKNIQLEQVRINTETDYVGAIIGYMDGGKLSHSSVEQGDVIGASYVGGLVGMIESGTIESCKSDVSVKGKKETEHVEKENYAGGVVGYSLDSHLSKVHALGHVEGQQYVGGLVGYSKGNTLTKGISDSSASGNVIGEDYVGGIVGATDKSIITHCVSLNKMIKTTLTNYCKRIGNQVDSEVDSGTIFSNNYAWEGVMLSGVYVEHKDSGMNTNQGGNQTADELVMNSVLVDITIPDHVQGLDFIQDQARSYKIHIKIEPEGSGTLIVRPGTEVTQNQEVVLLPAPEAGYHFVDWDSPEITRQSSILRGEPVSFYMPRKDVYITATFEKNEPESYTIQIDNSDENGLGWIDSQEAESAKKGDQVTLNAKPTDENSFFERWEIVKGAIQIDAEELLKEKMTFTMPGTDVELKPIFKRQYAIKANSNGKGRVDVVEGLQYAFPGKYVELVANPDTQSRFVEWRVISGDLILEEHQKTHTLLNFTMPSSDVEIMAVYEDISPQEYSVVINYDAKMGMGTATPATAQKGKYVELNAILNEGYKFVKWKVLSGDVVLEDETARNTSFIMQDQSVQLEVQFEAIGKQEHSIALRYEPSKGIAVAEPEVAVKGDIVEISARPQAGYHFVEWVVMEGDVVLENPKEAYTQFVMPDMPVKIGAVFEENKNNEYSIDLIHNIEEGAAVATPSVAQKGKEVSIVAIPLEGYHFKEWKVIEGDVILADPTQSITSFTMPASHVKVKAVFEKNKDGEYTVRVKYSNEEGIAWVNSTVNKKGDTVAIEAQPKAGYEFSGWKVINGSIELQNHNLSRVDFIMPGESLTIQATFNKQPIQDEIIQDSQDQYVTSNDKVTSNIMTAQITQEGEEYVKLSKTFLNESKQSYVKLNYKELYIILDKKALQHINEQVKGNILLKVNKLNNHNIAGKEYPKFKITLVNEKHELIELEDGCGEGMMTVGMYYTPSQSADRKVLHGLTVNQDDQIRYDELSYYCQQTKSVVIETHQLNGIYGIGESGVPFIDIRDHWAEEDIVFTTKKTWFKGVEETLFEPDLSITRGMFMTLLGRINQVDTNQYQDKSFEDVDQAAYYAPYIEWANESGIIQGMGNDLFMPNKFLTREEMAVIMYNYIQLKGYSLNQEEIEAFTDQEQISPWAEEAIHQMRSSQLMIGKNNHLFAPKEMITRAEIATILTRFDKLYLCQHDDHSIHQHYIM